jgi:hypothetical protein
MSTEPNDNIKLNVFDSAVCIVDPGACNGVAVARSLATIMLQLNHSGRGTDFVNKHPAVQLIIHQLGYLATRNELLNQGQFENSLKVCRACANDDLQGGIPQEKFAQGTSDEVVLLDTLTDEEFDLYALTCAMGLRQFNVRMGRIEVYEGQNSFWIIDTQSCVEASDTGASIRQMGDMVEAYTSEALDIKVGNESFYVTLMNDIKHNEGSFVEAYFGSPLSGLAIPEVIPTKFRYEVAGAGQGDKNWATNGKEFDSAEEAAEAANNMLDRWTGMRGFRVVPVTQPRGEKIEESEVRTH